MAKLNNIVKIAEDYFAYLARNYPVMCLSDEFYFFPRAKKSADFLNVLESLDQQKINQDIAYIKNLKRALEKLSPQDLNLEAQIDLAVLNQSISTFLREFEMVKIWQIDPNLYLKVILFGIEQVRARFAFIKTDIAESLRSRITQIPRLLKEAQNNLKQIPLGHQEVALQMIDVLIDYFKAEEINVSTRKVLESLEDFKSFLIKRPSDEAFFKDRCLLEAILKDSFSYQKSLKVLFDIATEEYRKTLEELTRLAKEIKPQTPWQQILSAYKPEAVDINGLLELYSGQIQRIKDFLNEKDVITIPPTQNIRVRPTPEFMKPIRASASYSAPITNDPQESAYFYITPDFGEVNKSGKQRVFSNIHNEYIFITAHETYPGHHLLDSIRRTLKNPIRQQLESPLFYEGWASYAESLIDQSGYINNPLQRLVGLKRRAWRAVRAMLDVGVRTNKLKVGDAGELLTGLGYDAGVVKLMLRHYVLTPGYQLCYTIGKFEIEQLKKQFLAKFGLKKFHDFLLAGGQIPFDLIQRRLQT